MIQGIDFVALMITFYFLIIRFKHTMQRHNNKALNHNLEILSDVFYQTRFTNTTQNYAIFIINPLIIYEINEILTRYL